MPGQVYDHSGCYSQGYFRSLTLMRLCHIRAGSLLSRISQRTLAKPSPKGIWPAGDAGSWWDHSTTAQIASGTSTVFWHSSHDSRREWYLRRWRLERWTTKFTTKEAIWLKACKPFSTWATHLGERGGELVIHKCGSRGADST